MSDITTRRRFLTLLGLTSSATLLGACDDDALSAPADASSDLSDARSDTRLDARSDATLDAMEVTGPTCTPTGSDVLGPFHLPGAPERTQLADTSEPGERLFISGTVYGDDCATPLAGALLDIWQADQEGDYHGEESDWRLRGQIVTDAEGRYAFESIRPGNYPLGGSVRPAHIHFQVSHPGRTALTTQLYFSDDPYLAPNDPCGACNSGDPTLIIDLEERDGAWLGVFDIVLA